MLYELRIYTAMPGRMPDMLARFQNHTLRIWERYGFRPVGFFTPLIGPDSNELTYLLAWTDLAERELRWDAFVKDAEWATARTASESNGPIVARMANSFLKPTAFSALT